MKGVQKETIRNNKGRTHFTFRGVRLGGCLFLFCIIGCTNKRLGEVEKAVQHMSRVVRHGDVIVRNGIDEVSHAARNFNRKDKAYSHCGLIQVEQDTVFVYHALGGSYNPSQKLLRQSLTDFCTAEKIDKVALYRYALSATEADKLRGWVKQRYAEGLPFDLFFNFQTDESMYCSEFVFKGLDFARSGTLRSLLPQNEVVDYVSIDDLYLNGMASKVYAVSF